MGSAVEFQLHSNEHVYIDIKIDKTINNSKRHKNINKYITKTVIRRLETMILLMMTATTTTTTMAMTLIVMVAITQLLLLILILILILMNLFWPPFQR